LIWALASRNLPAPPGGWAPSVRPAARSICRWFPFRSRADWRLPDQII